MSDPCTHISIAHSPDSDDVFMCYGLATGKVGTPGIRYTFQRADIQQLNDWSLEGRFDITALSVHAYAYVADRYALLRAGASMGEADYGPMVVAREPMTREQLRRVTIAVPGKRTSAYLALQLAIGPVDTCDMRFDTILESVRAGRVAAGLLVHEHQLLYAPAGLCNVLPLYEWWAEQAPGLPFPLGVNAIRRELAPAVQTAVARDLQDSITYGLAHRAEAAAYTQATVGNLTNPLLERYLDMYVNRRTIRMGAEEELAITTLLRQAHIAQLIPDLPPLTWST